MFPLGSGIELEPPLYYMTVAVVNIADTLTKKDFWLQGLARRRKRITIRYKE